jgi:hypothetical protein
MGIHPSMNLSPGSNLFCAHYILVGLKQERTGFALKCGSGSLLVMLS